MELARNLLEINHKISVDYMLMGGLSSTYFGHLQCGYISFAPKFYTNMCRITTLLDDHMSRYSSVCQ